ncbi:unnamed protein product [Vitrella brassicaformis CCMP3155]|uniref:Uncharacterized protein n=1 Tax=Vitrella brassicaformis (strain CCMP3155) TaxID=1169540 RepID=A0A0G4G607_VITBC|nr:unnamed protein product [Vitrella brassicaformis CCMP3155]|eukprot:CEM23970.1 unnamed protein product [Vitrella brassicaformis CCMP3155]
MGTVNGQVLSVAFKSNDEVDKSSFQAYDAIKKKYPDDSIAGIQFDPTQDPEDPHLYVAHAPFFYWWKQGYPCFNESLCYVPFPARISRLSGPGFSQETTLLENLP